MRSREIHQNLKRPFWANSIENPPGGEHRRPPISGDSWPTLLTIEKSFLAGPLRPGKVSANSRQGLGISWRFGARPRHVLAQDPPRTLPKPSKIEAGSLQNRAWNPPRRYFQKTFNLRGCKRATIAMLEAFWSQLGSILEAPDPPKSRSKPQNIDVENRHVSGIDF